MYPKTNLTNVYKQMTTILRFIGERALSLYFDTNVFTNKKLEKYLVH